MKLKSSNIIQSILVTLLYASFFLTVFDDYHWVYGTYAFTVSKNFYDKALSDFADGGILFFILILLASLVTLYMCKASDYFFKNQPLPKFFAFSEKLVINDKYPITYFMPVVSAFSLGIYCLLIDGGKVGVSYTEIYYECVSIYMIVPAAIIVFMIANCIADHLKVNKLQVAESESEAYAEPSPVIETKPEAPVIEAKAEAPVTETKAEAPVSEAKDELMKLKELLDMNLITQEDYDKKKNQILGL